MRIKSGEPGSNYITGVSVEGKKLDLTLKPVYQLDTEEGWVDIIVVKDGRPQGEYVVDPKTEEAVFKPELRRMNGKVVVEFIDDFVNGIRRTTGFAGGSARRYFLDIRVDDHVRDGAHIFNGDGVFIPQDHLEKMTFDDFTRMQYAATHFDDASRAAKANKGLLLPPQYTTHLLD